MSERPLRRRTSEPTESDPVQPQVRNRSTDEISGETAGQGDSIGYVGFSEQASEEFFGDAW